MTGRVAVIGDVGGHVRELRRELVRLGADPDDLVLPDDLVVVQVGDLVHRGPDSREVVALVDRYLTRQPAQWVQLAGNHEAQYIRQPVFEWPERVGPDASDRLVAWWLSGAMRPAAAIDAGGRDWLVTHAGLTAGYWDKALGRPTSALHAATALNGFVGTHDDVLFHAGEMLGGGNPDLSAGPVWASAAGELVPSWLAADAPMPFDQLHGHASITDWRRRRLRCSDDVAAITTIDITRAHETSTIGARRIVGVDPKHGHRAHKAWQAYVLTDARILTPAP